ncbi:MAG: MATE family efflux transporter, partial [Treponema sp.]|nr:MATE family efflux transporter [Treponema sp.]
MTKEERRQKILTEPILPLLVKTSIPTIIGMLVMTIYNLTDTFFIGRLGNKSMTAAIGISFSFVSMIQALGFWFGY